MALAVVSVVLAAALIMTFYLTCITFRHCQNDKRYYFVLSLASVMLYIFGYLLQILAKSDGAALSGMRVYFIGSLFLPATFLLFAIDFCKIEMSRATFNVVRYTLTGFSLIISAFVLTSDLHTLVFVNHFFDYNMPFRGLQFDPGVLYGASRIYSIICLLATCGILLERIVKSGPRHRRTLALMLITTLVPLITDGMFTLATLLISPDGNIINFMPFTLVIIDIVFYYTVVRYSLFDFIPIAYSTVLDSIEHAFIVVDPDMSCSAVNAAGRELFPDIVDCRNGVSIATCQSWPSELRDFVSLDRDLDLRFTISGASRPRYYSATVAELHERGRLLGYTVVIKDITLRQELLMQLELAAYTDGLTGIYNRRHFLELADKEFEKSKRLGMSCFAMVFDLDHFKHVNDTYGHSGGDEVLRVVSSRVRDTVRSYDLFARYGGEEFVVLIEAGPDISMRVAQTLAERIRHSIAHAPCEWDGVMIPVTISVGIAESNSAPALYDLLRNADEAMYNAKITGRNRVSIYHAKDIE